MKMEQRIVASSAGHAVEVLVAADQSLSTGQTPTVVDPADPAAGGGTTADEGTM